MKTFLWQGMYEDVGEQKPYSNLQHRDVDEAIRYLVYFRGEIEQALPVARMLNEYVEDQFVIWEINDHAVNTQCPVPGVMEQYFCYDPMEGHTANWILSLIALHSATGDSDYLDKAIAAANAICRSQTESGAFTTWGFDERFGRPMFKHFAWFSTDAKAIRGLIELRAYVDSLQAGQPMQPDLGEF